MLNLQSLQLWLRGFGSKRDAQRRTKRHRRVLFESVESRILLAADLTLDVGDGDATGSPGGSIVYNFAYGNTGDADAAGVVINTRLPRHTSFDAGASDAGWTCAGSSCSLELGDLAAGGNGTAVLSVVVDSELSPRVRGVSILGKISDNGEGGREESRRNNYGGARTPIIQQLHDLTLNFHDSRATVVPGGTIVYTAQYANAGVAIATGATITIDLPDQTTFNSEASTKGWSCDEAGTCTLAVGEVEPGAEGTATFAVDVSGELSAEIRRIRAAARIADDGNGVGDANRHNNSDGAWTPVEHALPDLTLSMDDGDEGILAGGTIVYALDYSNVGSVDTTGAAIHMSIPNHTTLDAAASSDGWTCDDEGDCTLEVGTIAAGTSGTATFAVVVDTELSRRVRRIRARAHIADDGMHGEDAKKRNNVSYESISVIPSAPDVALDLVASDDVAPGGTIVYTLNYTNKGPIGAAGVMLTFRVPRGTAFSELESPEGWSCEDGQCRFAVGELEAGSSGSVAIAVTVDAAAQRRIFASAKISDDRTRGHDGNYWNNWGFAKTEINAGGEA